MARRKKGLNINGWINVYKPYDMGSTDVVNKVRRFFNAKKAGHAGTLDPLAEGILPIALGEATKTIPYIQDRHKIYIFEVSWGEQRSTDDMEGEIIKTSPSRPDIKDIEKILLEYTGEIEQTPPKYSAIKINGERAYDMAREGKEVKIKSRKIFIEELKIIEHSNDKTTFEIVCGKGTYVRSLARDFGIQLGCYGYVSYLERVAVGSFTTKNAILLDKLLEMDNIAAFEEILLPVETSLDDILELAITEEEASRLKNGQALRFVSKHDVTRLEQSGFDFKADYEEECLTICNNKPIGIAHINKTIIKPVKIFNL